MRRRHIRRVIEKRAYRAMRKKGRDQARPRFETASLNGGVHHANQGQGHHANQGLGHPANQGCRASQGRHHAKPSYANLAVRPTIGRLPKGHNRTHTSRGPAIRQETSNSCILRRNTGRPRRYSTCPPRSGVLRGRPVPLRRAVTVDHAKRVFLRALKKLNASPALAADLEPSVFTIPPKT